MTFSRASNHFRQAQLPLLILIISSASIGVACRWLRSRTESQSKSANSEIITASTPPFSTREPERYQATRIITTSQLSSQSGDLGGVVETSSSTTLIARDGDKRREEYESGSGQKIVYLEIATGRFVLLPLSKTYTDLASTLEEDNSSELQNDSDFSPDRLINEARAETRYQKMGSENVNGRVMTKYRITVEPTAGATSTSSQTVIWIDEALGMPVRSETRTAGAQNASHVLMELKDLKTDVDQAIFELPKDYKKVGTKSVLDQIRGPQEAQR